jgi:hypothetical protein
MISKFWYQQIQLILQKKGGKMEIKASGQTIKFEFNEKEKSLFAKTDELKKRLQELGIGKRQLKQIKRLIRIAEA